MTIISWKCRGLGGPATIPQLKESTRLNSLDVVFICETNQSKGFTSCVCRNLKFGDRWDRVDPVGKKGGMVVSWSENVEISQIRKNSFLY